MRYTEVIYIVFHLNFAKLISICKVIKRNDCVKNIFIENKVS